MIDLNQQDLSIAGLHAEYERSAFTPKQLVDALREKIFDSQHCAWIYVLSEDELEPYIQALTDKTPEDLPLYGIPFAIKDNIDLAGVPTTAGYAEGAYMPEEHAFVVDLLIKAGAIPLGKTNMDQFATGLVGTRTESEEDICHNALNPDMISGGSSSGSAVALALGHVSFSLGTDTAGSGRVPGALNNVLGLKPTPGLLSTRGVVPACPSLDCVSVFVLSSADANTVFDVAAVYDEACQWSKTNTYSNGDRYFGAIQQPIKIAVPQVSNLNLERNDYGSGFAKAQSLIKELGFELADFDDTVLNDVALMLYNGPWVNDRLESIRAMIGEDLSSIHPVVSDIVHSKESMSVSETMGSLHSLEALKQSAQPLFEEFDVLMFPTVETHFTIDEALKDPIALNSRLGRYTNFVNLLDLSAVAVPISILDDKVGFGVTLIAPAKHDKMLLSFASQLENLTALLPGAQRPKPVQTNEKRAPYQRVEIVVCGAHLNGLPLNWQLRERGATFVRATKSAAAYGLYALTGGPILRPAMVRLGESGYAIEVEVWSIPAENLGSFLAEIPAPLGLGQVELEDGSYKTGFICEHGGIDGAEDISHFGGWKAWLASR